MSAGSRDGKRGTRPSARKLQLLLPRLVAELESEAALAEAAAGSSNRRERKRRGSEAAYLLAKAGEIIAEEALTRYAVTDTMRRYGHDIRRRGARASISTTGRCDRGSKKAGVARSGSATRFSALFCHLQAATPSRSLKLWWSAWLRGEARRGVSYFVVVAWAARAVRRALAQGRMMHDARHVDAPAWFRDPGRRVETP
jgi:hypothetical protein